MISSLKILYNSNVFDHHHHHQPEESVEQAPYVEAQALCQPTPLSAAPASEPSTEYNDENDDNDVYGNIDEGHSIDKL